MTQIIQARDAQRRREHAVARLQSVARCFVSRQLLRRKKKEVLQYMTSLDAALKLQHVARSFLARCELRRRRSCVQFLLNDLHALQEKETGVRTTIVSSEDACFEDRCGIFRARIQFLQKRRRTRDAVAPAERQPPTPNDAVGRPTSTTV